MKNKSKIIVADKPEIELLDSSDRSFLLDALSHGMSRREALTWMMAAGLTATTAGSLFTQAGSVMAAMPKRGGKLVYASDLHGPPDTLDPGLNTSNIDYTRGRTHYNALCQINDDLSTRPELAEEYSANADNSVWTFKLRKDVKFHDGSKFSADDRPATFSVYCRSSG